MVRQSLDADDAYVDVAQHGSGMTALQYRSAKGDKRRAQASTSMRRNASGLRSAAMFSPCSSPTHGEPLHQVGATTKLHFDEPFYVGIGVSGAQH